MFGLSSHSEVSIAWLCINFISFSDRREESLNNAGNAEQADSGSIQIDISTENDKDDKETGVSVRREGVNRPKRAIFKPKRFDDMLMYCIFS